jgi:hypothetical protein
MARPETRRGAGRHRGAAPCAISLGEGRLIEGASWPRGRLTMKCPTRLRCALNADSQINHNQASRSLKGSAANTDARTPHGLSREFHIRSSSIPLGLECPLSRFVPLSREVGTTRDTSSEKPSGSGDTGTAPLLPVGNFALTDRLGVGTPLVFRPYP